jgi:hypothetical protein
MKTIFTLVKVRNKPKKKKEEGRKKQVTNQGHQKKDKYTREKKLNNKKKKRTCFFLSLFSSFPLSLPHTLLLYTYQHNVLDIFE